MKMPEEVKLTVDGCKITVSGPKGTASKEFSYPSIKLEARENELVIEGPLSMKNTIEGHVSNMVRGVTAGYQQKLKILYSHFPISIEIKGREMLIKNFIGEKQPRKAKIAGATKVEIKGQEITLSSTSKEEIGQTIANMKSATKIRGRDSRVFQDGFYPTE